jgi:hypothetical protein
MVCHCNSQPPPPPPPPLAFVSAPVASYTWQHISAQFEIWLDCFQDDSDKSRLQVGCLIYQKLYCERFGRNTSQVNLPIGEVGSKASTYLWTFKGDKENIHVKRLLVLAISAAQNFKKVDELDPDEQCSMQLTALIGKQVEIVNQGKKWVGKLQAFSYVDTCSIDGRYYKIIIQSPKIRFVNIPADLWFGGDPGVSVNAVEVDQVGGDGTVEAAEVEVDQVGGDGTVEAVEVGQVGGDGTVEAVEVEVDQVGGDGTVEAVEVDQVGGDGTVEAVEVD